jgi:hypothetical protein
LDKRYRALRIIGTVYKIFGILAGIMTIFSVLAVCGTSTIGGMALDEFSREFGGEQMFTGLLSGVLGGVFISLFIILSGGVTALGLYALGEGIYLLISMEENTRATAAFLYRQPQAQIVTQPSPSSEQ